MKHYLYTMIVLQTDHICPFLLSGREGGRGGGGRDEGEWKMER